MLKRLLTDQRNIIKAILTGYTAAFLYILFSFAVADVSPNDIAPSAASEASEAEFSHPKRNYSRASSQLKDLSGLHSDEVFSPGPDKLNLAYLFPDGADTSDSINSYAGKVFTELTSMNSEYFSSFYDMTDTAPAVVCSRLGIGAERIMGRYDPEDDRHRADDPSTWSVNSFDNIDVSFYDGDGKRIEGAYCVREIMALANVYAYYHDPEDHELFSDYCRELFEKAVSSRVSIGSVYYCSGCLNRTVQEESEEAIASESEALSAASESENVPVRTEASDNASAASGTVSSGALPSETAGSSQISETKKGFAADRKVVVSEGKASTSSDAAQDGTATEDETYTNDTDPSDIPLTDVPATDAPLTDGSSTDAPSADAPHETGVSVPQAALPDETGLFNDGILFSENRYYLNGAIRDIDNNVVVSPASSAAYDPSNDPQSEDKAGGAGVSDNTADSDNPADSGSEDDSDNTDISDNADSADASDTSYSAQTSSDEAAVPADHTLSHVDSADPQTPYCPGHIDLYVSITIRGTEDYNSIFSIDPNGNSEENFNDQWKGWTEERIEEVRALLAQDWFDTYGLSISSIRLSSELSAEEIERYIKSIPDNVSQLRKDIVHFALDSVGRVPYYWGGKPFCGGYDGNNFGRLISPDYRGRILKGLDCSGWVNWVYWSVTGESLNGQSTGTLVGCGTRIRRSELQPGDIIIRTGQDSHVVMFLCWSQNGNIICIHESGGVVNNVEVSEMTANWPYYRSLAD